MQILVEVQNLVLKLGAADLERFRRWFVVQDLAAWKHEIETDADEGKLDGLVAEAVADYWNGRPRRL